MEKPTDRWLEASRRGGSIIPWRTDRSNNSLKRGLFDRPVIDQICWKRFIDKRCLSPGRHSRRAHFLVKSNKE